MVSKFQFFLDGVQVQDPKGWEDLDTTIKRDYTIQGLLITQESQPEFYGDGYDYIKNKFDNSGFCDSIDIEIKQTCDQLNYETIFNGIIFLSDCVFDLMRCSVKVKTVDDGFYAKINNNKSIKAKVNVGRSKSDVAITPVTPINIEVFYPGTGAWDATTREVYKAFDVFQFLVAFMSDGTMNFVSDDFDTGGQWEGVTITTGLVLRVPSNIDIPLISFQDLFTELNKRLRLGMSIEVVGGIPTLRIENAEYFYTQTSAITLSDAYQVSMQMDTTQLYSIVHLGSSITDATTPDSNGIPHFPETIDFVGFQDEEFHTVGNCNIDRTLELSGQWIVSSNVIEQILYNFAEYDDTIVLINIDLGTLKATRTNWITPDSTPPYYYNELFTNQQTALRWLNGIPNSIAKYLGNNDYGFKASITTDTTFATINSTPNPSFGNIRYNDDSTLPNYDAGNKYNNVSFYYEANSAGLYAFYCETMLETLETRFDTFDMFLMVQDQFGAARYTVFNPSDTAVSMFHINTFEGGVHKSTWNNIILNALDRVSVQIYSTNAFYGSDLKWKVLAGSTFETSLIATGGGTYQTIETDQYKIKKYAFEYPITYDQYNTIKADPKKLITFTTNNGVTQTGWIDEIKYYHHNKVASLKLITN